jgi:hypothetical protein
MPTGTPPLAVYDGPAAKVTLSSWGGEDDPRLSVSISIKLPNGYRTGGHTFVAQSYDEVRLKALDHLAPVGHPAMKDVEECLAMVNRQLSLPIA